MAIVNLTPDSFSGDGFLGPARSFAKIEDSGSRQAGCWVDRAVWHALDAVRQGAAWVDLGAESSRPGALPLGEAEEISRLRPVLQVLVEERSRRRREPPSIDFRISVDTMKPTVMALALNEGADMLNDVNAFRAPGALQVAVHAPRVCVVHMLGSPQTMQDGPDYSGAEGGVVGAVRRFLAERIDEACRHGVNPARIVVDPGIGFGKTLEHNLCLLRSMAAIQRPKDSTPDQSYPVLIGVSRKRMIGEITGKPVHQRCAGSIGAAIAAFEAGASLLRVHDVGETIDALRAYCACRGKLGPAEGRAADASHGAAHCEN
jgi:dihydropteroate synthase